MIHDNITPFAFEVAPEAKIQGPMRWGPQGHLKCGPRSWRTASNRSKSALVVDVDGKSRTHEWAFNDCDSFDLADF